MEAWEAVKQATGTWLFTWDGGSADSYDIWLDGELLDTVVGGEYECPEADYNDAPPPLEIVADESDADAENDLYPPYVILQWREVTGADAYRVEQYIDSNWVIVDTIQDRSVGYYFYQSEPLTDGTAYDFRVSAVDVNNNAGTPVTFDTTIMCNPTPPEVSFDIDSSGDLVGSES